MAGAEKVAENIPGWVERLLIPTLGPRVRGVVKEGVDRLEKAMDAKFESVNKRIDSLEKRLPMVQDIADLKARLTAVKKRAA